MNERGYVNILKHERGAQSLDEPSHEDMSDHMPRKTRCHKNLRAEGKQGANLPLRGCRGG